MNNTRTAFATLGDASVIGTLITESGISHEQPTAIADRGFTVILA